MILTNRKGRLLFPVLITVLLFAITAHAGTFDREFSPPEKDVWGLYLKGDMVIPERDNPDEPQLAFGWPRRIISEVPLWGRSPAVVDIDRNGDWEIAIVAGDGRLFVFQHDGALYPGFPTDFYRGNRPREWENPTHRALASVGDIDGDSAPDLVYASDISHLHVVGENQHEPNPFPLDLNRGIEVSTVVTLDVNNDNTVEMVFTTFAARPLGGEPALLHIVGPGGNELNGWPVQCGFGSGSSPAVGDIDGDNVPEIVVASGRNGNAAGQIWAFELDGSRVNGFPTGSFENLGGSPILVDWDDSPGLEIIFAAMPIDSGKTFIHNIDSHAQSKAGFPAVIGAGHPFGNPILFGSPRSQILFGEFDLGGHAKIWEVARWRDPDTVVSRPVMEVGASVVGSIVSADMGGTEEPEFVVALAPSDDTVGRIMISGLDEEDPTYIDLADYGGGAFASSPTLWDVNRDGHTDIIAVTTDGRVLVWNTEGFLRGEVWPTERGDFSRSGRKMPPLPLGIVNPNDWNRSPTDFSLDSYPNPFNSTFTASFTSLVAGRLELGLYDLCGRLVVKRAATNVSAGKIDFRFDAGNLNISSGVYQLRWSIGTSSGSQSVHYLP